MGRILLEADFCRFREVEQGSPGCSGSGDGLGCGPHLFFMSGGQMFGPEDGSRLNPQFLGFDLLDEFPQGGFQFPVLFKKRAGFGEGCDQGLCRGG